jgi:hypothetical protein
MKQLIFDTGPLITAGKYKIQGRYLIEIVADNFTVIIPEPVKIEAVDFGKPRPDAQIIEDQLRSKRINLVKYENITKKQNRFLNASGLKDGDRAIVALYYSRGNAKVVVDDHVLYFYLDRLRVPKMMFPDVIRDLAVNKKIERESALRVLELIRPRYSKAVLDILKIEMEEI